MNDPVETNENWGACPKCGKPVLIDPETGIPAACASCLSQASKSVGALGISLLVLGAAAVIALVYYCIQLLL